MDDAYGRAGREVRKDGFFSFDMKVETDKPTALLFTYIGDDKNRSFDILVDGVKDCFAGISRQRSRQVLRC